MKVGFIGGGNMAHGEKCGTLDQPVWSPGDYGERSGRSRIRSCIPGSKAKPNKKYNKPRQKLHLTREDYRIDSSR